MPLQVLEDVLQHRDKDDDDQGEDHRGEPVVDLPIDQGYNEEICVAHLAELIEQVLRKERHHIILGCVDIIRYKWLLFLVIDLIYFEFSKFLLREVQDLALSAILRKLRRIRSAILPWQCRRQKNLLCCYDLRPN
jgi:hypothetical protein